VPLGEPSGVDAFRTHFLDRYFGYRRLYVDAIIERAPRRAGLAVASEVARLSFVIFGCALTLLVFGALAYGLYLRRGLAWSPLLFAALAALPAALGMRASFGVAAAMRDVDRVRRAAAGLG
jgi:hypothetical protein